MARLNPAEPVHAAAEVVPDWEADSIHVARLPREGGASVDGPRSEVDTAVQTAAHPVRAGSSPPPDFAQPPILRFVISERRQTPIDSRTALRLIVAVMMAASLWVLIASSTGGSSGSRKAPLHLTPTEQRAAAAARARAAATAQAKRDHGTDAQWQDTIPAAAPPPRVSTTAAKAAATRAAAP